MQTSLVVWPLLWAVVCAAAVLHPQEDECSRASGKETCATDQGSKKGASLMQMVLARDEGKTKSNAGVGGRDLVADAVEHSVDVRTISLISGLTFSVHGDEYELMAKGCASRQSASAVDGKTATLDQSGYETLASYCCTMDMIFYIERVITQATGEIVCSGGGLTGLSWYYDCHDDQKTYADLVADVNTIASDECSWTQASEEDACKAETEACKTSNEVYQTGPLPNCNHTICCANATRLMDEYKAKARNFASVSAVEPFDCVNIPGAVQVLTSDTTGPFENISALDVTTGTYTLLWQFPTSLTTPSFNKTMNSASINPIDGRAYATVSIGNKAYIVRFDSTKFEFIAQLPPASDFSGATPGTGGYILGAFGQEGKFFIGCGGKNKPIIAIPNVAMYAGYLDQNDAGLTILTSTSDKLSFTHKMIEGGADFVVGTGDWGRTGTLGEWLFSLNKDGTLSLCKLPASPESIDNMEAYKLTPTTGTLGGTAPTGFGAGWIFGNSVFFSRNNGDGVWAIYTDTIDLDAGTFEFAKIGSSVPTSINDGFNCMDAPPPFQGGCPDGQAEVDVGPTGGVGHQCPEGSYRLNPR